MPEKSNWAPSVLGTKITPILPSATWLRSDGPTQTDGCEEHAYLNDNIDYDILFQVLSNDRRRKVIYRLYNEQSALSIGCIAKQLAADENNCSVRNVNSKERKRTYVALYQCHLPKLADAGIVEYDRGRGTVSPGPNLEIAHAYLTDPISADEMPPVSYTAPPVAVGLITSVLFSSPLMGLAVAGSAVCLIFSIVVANRLL